MIGRIKEAMQGKAPLSTRRSPHWGAVRAEHLKNNPVCALCEGKVKLRVHHIKPFHLHPELELEPTNLITLCECLSHGINCHLLVGHLGNFRNVNHNSVADVAAWNAKLKERNNHKDDAPAELNDVQVVEEEASE